jgi:hypothetical protein
VWLVGEVSAEAGGLPSTLHERPRPDRRAIPGPHSDGVMGRMVDDRKGVEAILSSAPSCIAPSHSASTISSPQPFADRARLICRVARRACTRDAPAMFSPTSRAPTSAYSSFASSAPGALSHAGAPRPYEMVVARSLLDAAAEEAAFRAARATASSSSSGMDLEGDEAAVSSPARPAFPAFEAAFRSHLERQQGAPAPATPAAAPAPLAGFGQGFPPPPPPPPPPQPGAGAGTASSYAGILAAASEIRASGEWAKEQRRRLETEEQRAQEAAAKAAKAAAAVAEEEEKQRRAREEAKARAAAESAAAASTAAAAYGAPGIQPQLIGPAVASIPAQAAASTGDFLGTARSLVAAFESSQDAALRGFSLDPERWASAVAPCKLAYGTARGNPIMGPSDALTPERVDNRQVAGAADLRALLDGLSMNVFRGLGGSPKQLVERVGPLVDLLRRARQLDDAHPGHPGCLPAAADPGVGADGGPFFVLLVDSMLSRAVHTCQRHGGAVKDVSFTNRDPLAAAVLILAAIAASPYPGAVMKRYRGFLYATAPPLVPSSAPLSRRTAQTAEAQECLPLVAILHAFVLQVRTRVEAVQGGGAEVPLPVNPVRVADSPWSLLARILNHLKPTPSNARAVARCILPLVLTSAHQLLRPIREGGAGRQGERLLRTLFDKYIPALEAACAVGGGGGGGAPEPALGSLRALLAGGTGAGAGRLFCVDADINPAAAEEDGSAKRVITLRQFVPPTRMTDSYVENFEEARQAALGEG